MRQLYQVKFAGVCAGVFVENGVVVDAAPIYGWTVGITLEKLIQWVKVRGGEVTSVPYTGAPN